MKRCYFFCLALLAVVQVHAARLANIVEFTPPAGWIQADPKITDPRINPELTIKFVPQDGRHAEVLLTLFMADDPNFPVKDPASLQRFNLISAAPYLPTPSAKPPVHELKVADGLGIYITNEDPNLVGKPTPPGEFRIATTVSLYLADKFLVHGTILYDQLDSAEFSQARQLIQTAKVRAAILMAIAKEKAAIAAATDEEPAGVIARPERSAALHLPPGRFWPSPLKANQDPGYFIVMDDYGITLSGWLDQASRYRDMKTFWAREKASLVKNTGTVVTDETFKTINDWEVVLYTATVGDFAQKNIRACRVVGDTWADVHLSASKPNAVWKDLEVIVGVMNLEPKAKQK